MHIYVYFCAYSLLKYVFTNMRSLPILTGFIMSIIQLLSSNSFKTTNIQKHLQFLPIVVTGGLQGCVHRKKLPRGKGK